MRKILLFSALALLSAPGFAQKKAKKDAAKAEAAAQQESAANREDVDRKRQDMEMRMLTPMHHMLMGSIGHWQLEVKVWASPQAKEPGSSLYECETRPLGDGKFAVSEIRGMSNNMPYEARCVMGFNSVTQKFERVWFDNLSPGVLLLEGTYDEGAHKITYTGKVTDPRTHESIPIRQVLNLSDPGRQVLEVFTQMKEGKEYKSMELIYNRR
jgi:hypothetical protein